MRKLLLLLAVTCSFTSIWSQTILDIQPSYNGYINEGAATTTLGTYQANYDFQVKRSTGYSRWGYLEFPLATINDHASSINLKIYLSGNPPITDFPTTDDLNSTPTVVLGVNKINYSFDNTLTWNNRTIPDANNEMSVGTVTLTNASKSTWINIDITSLAKSMKAAGQTYIRFRFFVANGAGIGQLLHFRQMVMNGSTIIGAGAYYPRISQTGTLLTTPTVSTATNIQQTSAIANWTPVSNASGYSIRVYSGSSLVATFTANGQTTSSILISELQSNTAYTYKVQAIGDGITYADSNESLASSAFTTGLFYQSSATGNFSSTNTWQSSTDNATWVNAISIPSSTSSVTILSEHEVAINQNTVVSTLNINSGGKLTLNNGLSLTASTLNINSDASGTGTFVNNGTATIASASVNQYLASARNWYLSSPISTATVPTGSTYYCYQESGDNSDFSVSGATAYWKPNAQGTLMAVGKGYIAQPNTSATLSYVGTLNDGDLSINLSRTTGKTNEGFNLVGNPYPSYVSLKSMAAGDSSHVETTYWLRSKNIANTAYVFDTYNFKGNIAISSGSGKEITGVIAPMQAFWLRVRNGFASGTLTLHNSFRSHIDDVNNVFRAPHQSNIENLIVRLQVSNGLNTDETILYINPEARTGYDDYDSQKMSNNSVSVPEIFTVVGGEKLAINGLSNLELNQEIPLGFTSGATNLFSIKVNELSNFNTDMRIILKDKQINTEYDLTNGTAYQFNSDAVNTINRFAIIFRVKSVTTDVNNDIDNNNYIPVLKNVNNQITINIPSEIVGKVNVSVRDILGQMLENKLLTNTENVLNSSFFSGVYLVNISANGKTTTRKILVN
ncbi:MAG: T9SS type A sorting domain-containing protein [Paludibacter sp.]|nr:T9SS type A sorting domain-containing protein [Paludibacter sp.]